MFSILFFKKKIFIVGQEFLSFNSFLFPTPPKLDWNLVNANAGFLKAVSSLTRLRLQGLIQVCQTQGQVAVLSRGSAIIVVNMFERAYSSFVVRNIPLDGTYSTVFNGDLKIYSSQFGNVGANQTQFTVTNGSSSIQLGKYTVLVFEKK